jgi:hypothetical protein
MGLARSPIATRPPIPRARSLESRKLDVLESRIAVAPPPVAE